MTTITVPAKTMLFGEYAILHGAHAVGMTFPNPHFIIKIHIEPSLYPKIIINSSFFPKGRLCIESKQEDTFFCKLFEPWFEDLTTHELTIDVLESFPQDLGFGSSSALIAGINHGLTRIFKRKQGLLRAFESLKIIQKGRGSGYDVAIQYTSLDMKLNRRLCLWKVKAFEQPEKLFIKKHHKLYGCFVKTMIYSPTVSVIKKNRSIEFLKASSQIAELFLEKKKSLEELVARSNYHAKKEGLFEIDKSLDFFIHHMEKEKIPYKPLGAGLGDCIWILASKEDLTNKYGLDPKLITFSFGDQ